MSDKTREYFNSVGEAREFLEGKKQLQKDLNVTKISNKIWYEDAKLRVQQDGHDTHDEFQLSPTAWNQLMLKCQIPIQYAQRIPQDLLEKNVNRMLPNKDLMLRTEEDRIRGIVTPRYKPIDHLELLSGLEKFIQVSGHSLTKLFVTDDYMRWNILTGKERGREIGQAVQLGWDGINGETGMHPIARALFVLKLVCTNGMVRRDATFAFTTRHIKNKEDVLKDYWEINDTAADAMMDRIKQASVEALTASLTQDVREFVKTYIKGENDLNTFMRERRDNARQVITRMDLVDNITDYAKQHPEAVRREIESYAGSII